MSAPAYRDDDLQPVSIGKQRRGMRTTRHDLAVALDGDLFTGKCHALEQL
jgi:hypothetical protein